MADIFQLANRISIDLTTLIQNEIRKKGLVDSGALLNSVHADVKINGLDVDIKVYGLDYFKYLNSEYSIISDAKKTTEYNNIKKNIAILYKQLFLQQLKKK